MRSIRQRRLAAACCTVLLASSGARAQPAAAGASAFDGRWAVTLVCQDVNDDRGFARGYTFEFAVDVKDGRLSGRHGQAGLPSSLTLAGTVQPDGTVDIDARGRTGDPQYTVGRVTKSTPYSYRMRGLLTPTGGKATRLELRPCEATFSRP